MGKKGSEKVADLISEAQILMDGVAKENPCDQYKFVISDLRSALFWLNKKRENQEKK